MMMAGALHPPCRRKKLRPLRPRLTARTALCSVPSSSPHAAGRAGAPVFLPEENETAPAGACRRPTAAKRRLLGRRQTGRARSKREKEGYGEATGARLNDRRSRNDFPRVIKLSGGLSRDEWTSSSFRCRSSGGRGWMSAFSGFAFLSIDHRRGRRPRRPVPQGFAAYGGGIPLAGARRPVSPEPPYDSWPVPHLWQITII